MKTTTNELKTMCEDIREELNRLYEADFTDAEIEEMQEAGDPTSLYDYFNDVLDKAEAEGASHEENWLCAFLEWSGSRKHPKVTEITEEGIVKGNWFIRSDGSRKKTTANGFRFIKKIK